MSPATKSMGKLLREEVQKVTDLVVELRAEADKARLETLEVRLDALMDKQRAKAELERVQEAAGVLAWTMHTEGRLYGAEFAHGGMDKASTAKVQERIDRALGRNKTGKE